MIPLTGLSTNLSLSLITRERDKFEDGVKNDPISKREIESFKERIGNISSIDDLMDDYQVYSFVMKAFGLEDNIYAKAMNKKIMIADANDKGSLVNRLTNKTFQELNKEMGFSSNGEADSLRLNNTDWINGMIDKYVDQRLVDTQMNQSESVGLALDFEKKVSGLNSWYKVLADKNMGKFMRTALGLPDSMGTADVDAQARAFAKKMDIEDLQDPKVQQKLVKKFAAISDARSFERQVSNPVLTLFQSSTNSATWAPFVISPDLLGRG